MAQGSGLEMHVELAAVPMFDEALEYAGQWIVTGGGQRNREYYGQWVDFGPAGDEQIAVLCDPQTSGGLLISLPPDAARNAVEQMRAEGLPAAIIGAMQPGEPGRIVFR
jgi:selenide,water dikinase